MAQSAANAASGARTAAKFTSEGTSTSLDAVATFGTAASPMNAFITPTGYISTPVLMLQDTGVAPKNYLNVVWNEDDTSDRTLNLLVNGGSRSFYLYGNLTVESASIVNQDLTTDASPTFGNITDSGLTASQLVFTDGAKKLVSTGTS
ncbi:MAG: hypothetical protein M1338_01160, partial [Patescibacteria group bacterium]|nr:hypothetical protein [Patescibacteria group bacterium]